MNKETIKQMWEEGHTFQQIFEILREYFKNEDIEIPTLPSIKKPKIDDDIDTIKEYQERKKERDILVKELEGQKQNAKEYNRQLVKDFENNCEEIMGFNDFSQEQQEKIYNFCYDELKKIPKKF